MSLHSFEPEIASKVGVNAAVIYQNIMFWTRKNAANGKHIHDGKVWTYNSVKAINTLFEYLSPAQIRTAIGKLLDAGLIFEGNFNQIAYDRTKWYGVSCEIHLSKIANGVEQNRQPIPDSKPDIKPDRDTNVSLSRANDFEAFWDIVPRKVGRGAAENAFAKAAKKAPVSQIMDAMRRYAKERKGQDKQYTCHPATWLNQQRWLDERPRTQADFHDEIEKRLRDGNAHGLPAPDTDHNADHKRISSAVSAARALGRQ